MRRAAPEVEALATGQTSVILRGTGIRQPVPVVASWVNGFYGQGKDAKGVVPEDFNDAAHAALALEKIQHQTEHAARLLVVPVGHIRLPHEAWVSRLAAELTPWTERRVEAWRIHLKNSPWLSVVRAYAFEPVVLPSHFSDSIQTKVAPFRLSSIQPVLTDDEFTTVLEQIQIQLECLGDNALGRYSQALVQPEPTDPITTDQPAYSLQDFAAECGYTQDRLQHWEERVRRKRQVILYGPPGTGKTFMAERLAKRLVAGGSGFAQVLQFHAAYAYEDFVQGVRPKTLGGTAVFELQPGRFVEFCQKAEAAKDHPCVLVLDEINRAPLARVFGELMYLLEYRERAIRLAAGGEPFKIPHNVYLIGTMNTADRSLALVDQALRRRFAFIRLQPDYSILAGYLEKHGIYPKALIDVLEEINQCIADPNYLLGIAFFMQGAQRLSEDLPQIWQGEIEPYLEEVFFDQPEQVDAWRWEPTVCQRLSDGLPSNATD